jgi:multidrug efflux pump
MAAAVCFSSIVALSLSPMVASKILKRAPTGGFGTEKSIVNRLFGMLQNKYRYLLNRSMKRPLLVLMAFILLLGASVWLFTQIPTEYAPQEDRGAFFVIVNGPEGASYAYMEEYMDEIERRLMPLVESNEATRLLVRAPRTFSNYENFNTGLVIFVLNDWDQRRSAWAIMADVRTRLSGLPGVRAFPVMRQGFGGSIQKPLQFVIGGGTYEELARWRDILLEKIEADNPGLVGIDWDYKETTPQLQVDIDYDRSAELGVTIENIGRTLETMLGSRRVTTYIDAGEEYDVILEGERASQRTPTDLQNIYVRSARSGQLIPLSNLVTLEEFADSKTLNRYNRVRAITIEANLADSLPLGDALAYMENLVKTHLPGNVIIDYKGQSQDFKNSTRSIIFVLLLGIVVVFLVLAAQFESYINPFVIMLTVPLAIAGGLLGLRLTGSSLNLYSQIGLVMLVGLAAKNGILIVEFANQLRDTGASFYRAILKSAQVRLRPIIMTGITTAAGSLPLILSSGAGAETRMVIGIVVLSGVLSATVFTLFIVPAAYSVLSKRSRTPANVSRILAKEHAIAIKNAK